ncbi:MAG: hypothetical protein Q8S13_10755 [Dehalococcoidia bacterium]|nr:hypothetical protein [Dehalococcoidia bacterium]
MQRFGADALAALTREPAGKPPQEHILQFFDCEHLPPHLQAVSRLFGDLACEIMTLPCNPERDVALRKLLESKDAAVRTVVAKPA